MSTASTLRVRQSVHQMQARYDNGDQKPLEDLVRAWIGIQALPPTDPNSFFVIAGYHGEPFQYRRQVDELPIVDTYAYWGGYCNHGNILFPTWHRLYVNRVEEALRSIVPGVMLPYWDETSSESLRDGVPALLTQDTFMLDGVPVKNPLKSFVLPVALGDDLPGDGQAYDKPAGYETVRYPLSGLVGTDVARDATAIHNADYPDPTKNAALLNANILAWMRGGKPTPQQPEPTGTGIYAMFAKCLDAPNYTVFSNTSSAGDWNLANPTAPVTPLEQPHNSVHLAVGGFDMPGQGEAGRIADSNGDMGENNTAAMDPIFFFHHCNIDRMFWLWQQRHGATDMLTILAGYKGTSSSDEQGPTPGVAPGTALTLDSPLLPFTRADGSAATSRDCVNIETQLGFTYAPGSFDGAQLQSAEKAGAYTPTLAVRGIDRAMFQGSFVLHAYAEADGQEVYLGHYPVLSRRNVVRCKNCLTHMEVVAHFPLSYGLSSVDESNVRIEIDHRGNAQGTALLAAQPTGLKMQLKINR